MILAIDPGQEPIRIDKFLSDRIGRISRNRIQQAIRAEAVRVDQLPVKPNYRVKPGNVVSAILPVWNTEDSSGPPKAQAMDLDVVYEDDDLLIVNKQAGLVVHPGVGNWEGTLVNGLAHYLGVDDSYLQDDPLRQRLGLVHRIDKDTSGLLVVAKNDFALSFLARQFSEHTIERCYYAIVWGVPNPPNGKIEAHIGRSPRDRKAFTIFPEGEEGKWALTHYEMLEDLYYVSLVKCRLETGRTHQIRVHFQSIGHPLFNDEKYGGSRIVKGTPFSRYRDFVQRSFVTIPRQALHAKTLGFIHPSTRQFIRFESNLPADFEAALLQWRQYFAARQQN